MQNRSKEMQYWLINAEHAAGLAANLGIIQQKQENRAETLNRHPALDILDTQFKTHNRKFTSSLNTR